jgi:type II secretory pathway pseudopilin PulG
MKRRNSSNFIIGLIIGVLVGVIVWYWQKSTSAEDGALALLDRLAAAERKLRELSTDFSRRTDGRSFTFGQYPDSSDDLQRVRGVGPAYEHRLRRAGITTIRGSNTSSEPRPGCKHFARSGGHGSIVT